MKRTTLERFYVPCEIAIACAFAFTGHMKAAAITMFVGQIIEMLYKKIAKPTLED